jgi:hypothetical protein
VYELLKLPKIAVSPQKNDLSPGFERAFSRIRPLTAKI